MEYILFMCIRLLIFFITRILEHMKKNIYFILFYILSYTKFDVIF